MCALEPKRQNSACLCFLLNSYLEMMSFVIPECASVYVKNKYEIVNFVVSIIRQFVSHTYQLCKN